MKNIRWMALSLAAGVSLAGCNTTGYGNDPQLRDAATGAAIGAAGGAAVGAVVGGVSPVEGAIAGAVAGAVVGAVTSNDRRWVRDNYGRCYYVNERGDRVYDRERRC